MCQVVDLFIYFLVFDHCKTFNGLRKIFEQDLRARILLSLLFSGVAPLNKDLSVFTFVLFEKLNYLNMGLPQDQPHQDSSLLLPTELSDGNAKLNVVMIQENSGEKLRAFLFLLFKLMLKRCTFVMSSVEYNYMLQLFYWCIDFDSIVLHTVSLTSDQDFCCEYIHVCVWRLFTVKSASLIMSIRVFGLSWSQVLFIKYIINANLTLNIRFSAFIYWHRWP